MANLIWKDEITKALEQLGGEAHLSEFYRYIEEHTDIKLSSTWHATVRGALERASSDSEAFDGKDDLYYSVGGLGSGYWGLRSFKRQ